MLDKILRREPDTFDDDNKDSGLALPALETHKDPFSSPDNLSSQKQFDFNNPDINMQTGIPKPDPYKETSQPSHKPQPQNPPLGDREFQLIIAKLDTIKAEIDSLQQRVQKIERIAEGEQQSPKNSYGRW